MSTTSETSNSYQNGTETAQNSSFQFTSIFKVKRKKIICTAKNILRIIDSTRLDEKNFDNLIGDARVAKIENLTSIQHFYQVIRNEDFIEALQKSPHCFVFAAEVPKTGFSELEKVYQKLSRVNFGRRPMIVMIRVERSDFTGVFFKQKDEEGFSTISTVDKKVDFESFNFETFLNSVDLKLAEISNLENFLKTEIDNSKKFSGKTLTEHSILAKDVLSLRFLGLFCDSLDLKVLESVVKTGDHEIFSAYIGLPFENDIFGQRSICELMDNLKVDELQNLLENAAKFGAPKTIEMFAISLSEELKLELDLIKICESAASGKNIKNVIVLVENDFMFPQNFDEVECEDLSKISKQRDDFHKAIQNCDREAVEKFIFSNLRIKIGYNRKNMTAMAYALKCGRKMDDFDIYSLLMYHQFRAPNDAFHEGFFRNLSPSDKEEITKNCANFYGRPVDSHIFFIYSKSRMGTFSGEKQNENFEKVKIYLEKLNKIPEIAPLLRVIENSETFALNFDFDSDTIHQMDLLSSDRTSGVCYHQSGRIYIGAKTSEAEILGTLSHELCHYAMKIIFQNNCKPYDENDQQNLKTFRDIVSACEIAKDHDLIVRSIFNSYPRTAYEAELIVRVPHMIVFNQHDKSEIEDLKEKYKNLFDFYETVLLKIENFLKNPQKFFNARNVQQINERLGGLQSFKICRDKETKFSTGDINLVVANVPQLAKTCVFQNFAKSQNKSEITASNIFARVCDFENEYFMSCFENSVQVDQISFVITCEDHDRLENAGNLWNFVDDFNAKLTIICNEKQAKIVQKKIKSPVAEQLLKFTWEDLSAETRKELLEKEILFQNFKTTLDQLVNEKCDFLKYLPLEELLNPQKIFSVGSPIKLNKGYDEDSYIKRNFYVTSYEDDQTEEVNPTLWVPTNMIDDVFAFNIFDPIPEFRFTVITDDAGKGKSISSSHLALEIKKLFPTFWLIRLDLNQYTDQFKNEFSGSVEEFVEKNFAGTKNLFESFLFRKLFAGQKVVMVFDGLDEIAPNFSNQFFYFLGCLKASSVHKVAITSRRHLKLDLHKILRPIFFEIEPFSPKDQIKFLIRFWSQKLKNVEETVLSLYATELIEQFHKLPVDQKNLIGIPLQTKMIAEIFVEHVEKAISNDDLETIELPTLPSLNVLYRQFILKKIQIVQSEKGELVGKEKAEIEMEGIRLLEVHEKFAYSTIFETSFESDLRQDVIQRYGIITLSNGKYEFLHRTFAEYLVATSVVRKLMKKNPEIEEEYFYKIIFDSYPHWNLLYLIELEIESNPEIFENQATLKKIAEFLDENAFKVVPDGAFFIHRMIYQRKPILIKFLLECLKFSSEDLIYNVSVRVVAEGWNILSLATRMKMFDVIEPIADFVTITNKTCLWVADKDNLNAFQLAFLTQFYNSSEKSILELLFGIYKRNFGLGFFAIMILCSRYKKVMNGSLLMEPDTVKRTLSLRWKIAREVTSSEQDEKELINSDNLFTAGMKFILDCTLKNKLHIAEILSWAKENFENNEEIIDIVANIIDSHPS